MKNETQPNTFAIEMPPRWTFWREIGGGRSFLIIDSFYSDEGAAKSHIWIKEIKDGKLQEAKRVPLPKFALALHRIQIQECSIQVV